MANQVKSPKSMRRVCSYLYSFEMPHRNAHYLQTSQQLAEEASYQIKLPEIVASKLIYDC